MSESDVCRRQIMRYKDDPRPEKIKTFIMNRKELNKTFMMILNYKKPFGLHGLYTNISGV